MVTTELESETAIEWLKRARKRIDLPDDILKVNYQEDVDLLVIRFSDNPSIRGSMDHENDVIYNYDKNGHIVSVEILDLYGVFAEV